MYAIEHGFVQINDKPAPSDTILRDKDVLCHRVHRHEPPVFDSPIKILFEDSSIVAINKPYSIPVHPTGKFWFNTVESMMEFEMGYTDLYLVHRLDRLTSGVLVFAKVKQIAQVWGANIREHIGITKIYLARVEGVFPDEPVEVDQPILVVPKALCKIDASGKPSQTRFERVSTNGKESVVRCSYPHFLVPRILHQPLFSSRLSQNWANASN
jgi:tRNA pseudouridine synthase 8/2,5-diamino-6-(5-phospho-D-ribitylamino)-pyrimidin-4(3H)-one deaminase